MQLATDDIADFLISHMPAHNISSKAVFTADSIIEMPPNRLTQLCLGYLKIFQIVGPRSSDYQLINEAHPYSEIYTTRWAPKLIEVA